jgi:hypothetical protein
MMYSYGLGYDDFSTTLPNPIACANGMVLAADGSGCVYNDDLSDTLPQLIGNTGPSATGTTADEWGLLLQDATANLTPTTGETFLQWVNANSTLLLVGFGAIGALVALTRIGK